MKREILFLAHRVPFPPDRGDKIRSHHLLRRLSRIAPVHVATFADDDGDMAQEVELATLAHSYRLVRRAKPVAFAGLQSLLSGRSISHHAFHDSALADYVATVVKQRAIGTIFVFSGQMGQYVPAGFGGRVIVDFVDVDSAKYEAYAERGPRLLRPIFAREARLLGAEEVRLACAAQTSVLISAEEAALFRSRLPAELRADVAVRVLPNGTDSGYFDPTALLPEAFVEGSGAPRLIFTGQMDYAPNVEAVVRAARRIMPLVRKAWPEASFHIVGRNPDEQVRGLEGVHGTRVWGAVEDVRPWLKAADIALVPLEIARGVQNKVLEAMSMALPTVLTAAAATGIPATDRAHFVVADSDEDIALAVRRLAADREWAQTMGLQARAFVVQNLSWQTALADLPKLVGAEGGSLADAA